MMYLNAREGTQGLVQFPRRRCGIAPFHIALFWAEQLLFDCKNMFFPDNGFLKTQEKCFPRRTFSFWKLLLVAKAVCCIIAEDFFRKIYFYGKPVQHKSSDPRQAAFRNAARRGGGARGSDHKQNLLVFGRPLTEKKQLFHRVQTRRLRGPLVGHGRFW